MTFLLLFVSKQKVRRIKEFTYFNTTNTNNPNQKGPFPNPYFDRLNIKKAGSFLSICANTISNHHLNLNLKAFQHDPGDFYVKKKGNFFQRPISTDNI
ncbi:hypothetical protein IV494_08615 [Kaistella sp. G5-32]|uniref:Uncharacterized protein n=1 Tax=Kaistella gelatinilytica TaxID=2787636 RepID=A0ABS0FC11_9FLAO|nr:hypothetical protein [Kaistella gelatinilytica]MBF8457244.1 hypothetical protein [Kaistella gelatinilytica]